MDAKTIITLIDGSLIYVTQSVMSVYEKMKSGVITVTEAVKVVHSWYENGEYLSRTEYEYEPILINVRNILIVREYK